MRAACVSHYNLQRVPKVLFDLLVVVFLASLCGNGRCNVFGGVGLVSIGIA